MAAIDERAAQGSAAESSCALTLAASERGTTIGSSRQTGSGTKIVGVPAGFLVAMIVIILAVSLI